jgi:hypothetical protein
MRPETERRRRRKKEKREREKDRERGKKATCWPRLVPRMYSMCTMYKQVPALGDFSSFSPWTRQTEQQPVHPSTSASFSPHSILAVPSPPTILLCVLLTYAYISKFPLRLAQTRH